MKTQTGSANEIESHAQSVSRLIDTPFLNTEKVESVREALEKKVILDSDQFDLLSPFQSEWYPNNEKFLKTKLGKLFYCSYGTKRKHLCRVMQFQRITTYQLDQFFIQLTHLHMLKLAGKCVSTPVGVHINSEKTIHVIMPLRKSLYEVIHSEKL